MEAIKKILQPGKSKDDEILYGSGSSTAQPDNGSGAFNAGVPQGSDAPQLHTLPEEKKEHGVLRQILNPGGEKYDDSAYGSTATTDGRKASTAHDEAGTHQPKEHGVLRQILNPGGEKYDPASFKDTPDPSAKGERIPGSLATGSSAQQIQSQDAAHDDRGVLRQIINPGGQKYDGHGFDPTGQVGSGSSTNAPTSGTTATTHGSHTGRDAAIGGAAAGAGAGVLAHEAGRDHTTSGRSAQLDSTTGTTTSAAPHTSTGTAQSSYSQAPTGSTYGTSQTTSNAPSSTSHLGSGSTAATAGALGATGLAAHEKARHESSTGSGLQSTTQPSSQAYGSSSASTQPSSTGTYTGASTTGLSGNTSTSTGYGTTGSHSHHGAETAAVGAGALAAGGLAAHEHNKPSTTSTTAASQGDSGLSHHVHNSVTEQVPHKTGHHHHSSRKAEPAYEPTPFHATPAAYSGQDSQTNTGGKVYNTVTGSHSEHEPQLSGHSHHGAATGAGVGAAAVLTGASLADRSRHDGPSTTHGVGGTSSGLGASAPGVGTSTTIGGVSSLGSSAQPAHETSRHVPGAFPGDEPTSHSGYGTAGATGGTAAAALAAQEAIRRHETQQGTGSYGAHPTTQHGTTTSSYGSDPSQSHTQHHYGRDAAVVGGAGALGAGAYEAGKHGDSTGPASKTVGPHDSNIANIVDPRVHPQPEHQKTSTTTGPHKSDLLNKLDPRVQSDPTKADKHESHTGRDAALGAGAGAATGAGIYEAGKHHDGTSSHSSHPTTSSTTTQSGSSTTGPHSSSLLNKLDPRVKSDQTTSQTQHGHAGRDAAIGTGAGVATAGGIHEANKHHGSHVADSGYGASTAPSTSTTGYGSTSTAPHTSQATGHGTSSTTGPHDSSLLNKLDPRVKSDQSQTEKSHTGRDAAIVGGAGAATGAGIYETEKHHGHHTSSAASQPSTTTQTSSSGVHHDSALLNKLDPRVKSDQSQTEKSHTGRDAAVVGGAGAATGAGIYEAEKHHGHHTSSAASQPSTTTQTSSSGVHHDSALLNKLDPRVKTDQTQTSTHHAKESHHGHHEHTGRDAAVGAGAGAAGAGAYETHKHHGQGETARAGYGAEQTSGQYAGYGAEDAAVPHRSNLLNKLDPRIDSSTTGTNTQHAGEHSHTGRDAALAGGAGAAAGTGLYEAEKHHGHSTAGTSTTPGYGQSTTGSSTTGYGQSTTGPSSTGYGQSASGPASKTVGPHDSNVANVLDPRVKPQPELQKEHTTVGPHQSDTLNKLDPRVQHDPSKAQTSSHSHEGRDLATGAGVGAGAGYAAHETHEHDKKHHGPQVREDEHHHNKLHKEPKEKKEGFLHKLLHPHKKENEVDSSTHDSSVSHGHHDKTATGAAASTSATGVGHQTTGQTVDPHTGLPINVSQYGTGQGGTDSTASVAGYQPGSAAQGPDWKDISKQNTPY